MVVVVCGAVVGGSAVVVVAQTISEHDSPACQVANLPATSVPQVDAKRQFASR
jgi:hypothetical protein